MEPLFFGIQAPPQPINKELFALFTSNNNYLTKLCIDKEEYLGKKISSPLFYEELIDQKKHIISLLSRLFPNTTFSNDNFLLIPHVCY